MFHMRKVKIGESICVLVLLFSGLVTCSGVFGSPLTDDVATLETLSENIPNDYRIPLDFISKDMGFRFTLDREELEFTMQTFNCHYRRVKWPTRRFFAHVKDVLTATGSTLGEFHHCAPPPCKNREAPTFTPGQIRQQNGMNRVFHGLLALFIIPYMAVLVLTVRMVFRRGGCCPQRRHETSISLDELHDRAAESGPELHSGDMHLHREPLSGAAGGDPLSSPHSQQDSVWVDSSGSADTEV
ncbi:uncharacterized protein LOC127639253 isoform X2 [Xyrauchen texanus]|uniref:uncharacterized protein LOC127639253 isoform X2 n=1 Tax=Xyrauchen texanus TaxID=154827 RepID=UPI00224269D7|nr:uncharacterized protein LOC127639253 isoform X2 [Xyrauchen texanus]